MGKHNSYIEKSTCGLNNEQVTFMITIYIANMFSTVSIDLIYLVIFIEELNSLNYYVTGSLFSYMLNRYMKKWLGIVLIKKTTSRLFSRGK